VVSAITFIWIASDVPDDARMMGIPATPEREQKLKQVALARLPEMRRQLRALEATVARLQREEGPGGSTAAA
jgi:UDP-3-O-[3-hydroxymyristoyl] glucosamine N-acyltransferase